MSSKYMSVDEIVAALGHTSIPSIIIEGKEDLMVYRWIVEDVLGTDVSLFPCGGRNTLFEVYNRRGEFKSTPTLFIADKDVYVYGFIPPQYSDIFFTEGYSLENDLYFGRGVESLLSKVEAKNYQKARDNYIRYYGCQLEKLKNGGLYCLTQTPHELLDDKNDLIKDKVQYTFKEPSTNTFKSLSNNYDLLFRGHSIFLLLTYFLSKSGRAVTHSTKSLYELCYRTYKSKYINRLQDKIKEFETRN